MRNDQCQDLDREPTLRSNRRRDIYLQSGDGPVLDKSETPGMHYAPNKLLRMCCAMCGRQMIQAPATYAHWMRRADGTIAWLCDPCDGMPFRVHMKPKRKKK